MANRKNTFLIKRSNVAGKIPAAGDLQLGELALNTADNILYASGTTANSILPIGWDRVARTGDTMTGYLYAPSISATTISATTYLNLPSMTGSYLPLSGGTVTGGTIFTSGLTASTMSATTYYGDGSNLTGISAAATEFVVNCRNQSGSDMYRGQIVYMNGSTGNKPTILLAQANSEMTSARTFGVLKNDIPNNGDGDVVTIGSITNLDTRTSATHPFTIDTLSDGQTIYLSPTNAGYITNVKPYAPNHLVYIGKVVRTSPTNGYIEYQIQNGYELDELHDVKITGVTYGDLLTYSAYNGSNVWVNSKTLNGSYTVTGDTSVGGQMKATTVSATTYYNLPNVTLQQAYTASTSPEFTINSTQLGVQFRNDTGDDNTPMIVVQNNAGIDKGEWRADGTLYAAGLYSTGDVVITGNTYVSGASTTVGDVRGFSLVSTQSINDEGGEVRLATPQTNTSLSGGNITFDIYQNKLRFFESGGSNRGVYIDLTAAATGVGTNLLSGGGGEINTASNLGAGTGLFAQKVSADLQFKSLTSTGGTVTLTNNANTVNLEVVAASNFTGGTVTGATNFTGGLSANTISATTYYNLPTDIRVTGGTYSNGTSVFTNNTGGTFNVTGYYTGATDVFVTGGTYSNGSLLFTNNTGGTFNINTSTNYAAGVISGSTYSMDGVGQINLPAIKVALYNNANNIEPIIVYDVASGTTGSGGIPSLVDQDTNYIVVEYNGGSPRYYVYDNDGPVDDSSIVLFMIVYRAGSFIHTLEFGNQGAGLANKLNDRFIMTERFGWESGLSLGLSGSTGVVYVTSGVAWNGPNRQSLTAVNSSGDTFFKNYHVGGVWTYTTTGDTVNNTYYDNGTDIVTATASKYLTNWYYRGQETNGHIYEVYGDNQYDTVALAQLSTEPALPELVSSHAILVGRVIIQVSATTGLTESAFNTVFQATQVTAHNDLTGLQGGTAGQYYHLTSNQYNNLALTNVNNYFSTGQTITGNLTVTGGTQSIFSGNSSSDLVRITQTGSGNAFVVEDSATSDGNKFIIDNDGNVSIGLSAGYSPSKVYVASLNQSFAIVATNQSTGIISPIAIKAETQGDSTNTIIGVAGYANDGLLAYGVVGQVGETEFGSTALGIGGRFGSYGSGTRYSIQLEDGTEDIGKVLVSQTADGKANWSSTLTGLTTVQATTVSATTLQGDGSQITNITPTVPYGIINAIASGNYLI